MKRPALAFWLVTAALCGGAVARIISAHTETVLTTSVASKADALDAHCSFMRFQINGIRRDVLKGRSLDVGVRQYRELMTYDFENISICMLTADKDPMFFPTPCDFADKACVVNQLDIFLLVMR